MARHTSERIKEAMAAGFTAPKDIQQYIKKKHGQTVARTYISTRKRFFREQQPHAAASKQAASSGRRKGHTASTQHKLANGDVLTALKAVQEAADKVGGMGRLKALMELLGSLK